MSLSQQSSGYLSRPRADQVKFKSPPTYRRTDREVDADLAVGPAESPAERALGPRRRALGTLTCSGSLQAITKEGAQETAYPARSLQSLGSPSERKIWQSKDCPGKLADLCTCTCSDALALGAR
jgi:hypothetical protein